MSSATKSSNSKDYITRRIRDKDGNIIVKRYKKRSSSLNIQIPWNRLPSILVGTVFGLYAYIVNLYRNDNLDTLDFLGAGWGEYLEYYLDQFIGVTALLLTGAIAVGLGTFLAWALFTKGFRINKYGVAARQLIALVAITLLFSAVFSAFFNEAGIFRHQDNPVANNEDFDLSALSAPFYSELLDGLLDLIGNIPNPEEVVANIFPTDGGGLDYVEDTYLWRWLVAESYGTDGDPFDFVKGYEEYHSNFENMDPATFQANNPGVNTREFRVEQQYLTIGSDYTGEMVTSWNSRYDSQASIENPAIDANNADGVNINSISAYRNINSQPVVNAQLSEARTSGFFSYDTMYIQEDKQSIAQNTLDYETVAQNVETGVYDSAVAAERFGDLLDAGGIYSIWGADSLPGYYGDPNDDSVGNPIPFLDKYNNYRDDAIANGLSAYDVVLRLSNEIQNEIINMFQSGAADTINPSDDAATSNEAGEGVDRAYYFWEQVEDGNLFGIKDAIAGFVNILREMNIPARPIVGFSAGDVNDTQIQLKLEHINIWVEAFLPWDDNGTTRYSWGAFNPIPNYSYLINDGLFVYGQNSLGGQPDVEIAANSGEQTEIPDAGIGNTTDFTLAQMGEPLTVGTRVLYEGVPTSNQRVELKILNEQEINDIVSGAISPDDASSVGTDLATVTTSSTTESWANFSLFADFGQDLQITFDGNTTDSGVPIDLIDFTGSVNNRNVYAIVAQFGLAFNYIIVGWSLDAQLTINAADPIVAADSVSVTDPGIFSENTFTSMYTFAGEDLSYNVTVQSPESDPIANQDVDLYFLNPDDLANLETSIADGTLPSPVASGTTDGDGFVQIDFTVSASDISVSHEYYALVALVPPDNYEVLNIHITEDFVDIGSDITNDGDFIINSGETVQWDVDHFISVTDLTLDAASGGGITGRNAIGLDLEFFIVERDAFITLNNTEFPFVSTNPNVITFLGSCETNYAIVSDCYQLASVSDTLSMGVLSDGISGGTEQLNLISGIVPYSSYYIFMYSQGAGLYNVTASQKFVFFPPPSALSVDNSGIVYDYKLGQFTGVEVLKQPFKSVNNPGHTADLFIVKMILMMSFATIVVTLKNKEVLQ